MDGEKPVIDNQDQEALFETLLERADQYIPTWDAHSKDPGRTLLRIFSTFEGDVRKRLNDVPEKHLLGFLDALDFERKRPQAARTPISFSVSGDLDRNVPIPGGTTINAESVDAETQQFELPQDGGFEATPARLQTVVCVSPETDEIVNHSSLLDGDRTDLFEGPNLQSHTLYLANEDALNLDAGSTFSARIEATDDPDLIFAETTWEYYGENEDGDAGWHPLEVVETADIEEDDSGVKSLQAQLKETSRQSKGREDLDTVSERLFAIPGNISTCEINDVESRWIRCSTGAESSVLQSRIDSISLHLSSKDRGEGIEPDVMLSNDVPLDPEDGPVRPFGRNPHPPVMFFLACEEALTKPGGVVEVTFIGADIPDDTDDETDIEEDPAESDQGGDVAAGAGVLDGPPQISWEYWNGAGWTRLDSVSDGTDALQNPGRIRFEVPQDIGETTVSGQENVWIRARLVGGSYGQQTLEMTDSGAPGSLVDTTDEPLYDDVIVQYEQRNREFETIFSHNNGSYSENLAHETGSFSPFENLPDEDQTVYFGFDNTLKNGPLSLFMEVEDTTYPPYFDPGIEWEYCTDPEQWAWEDIDVRDQTGGFTERGNVLLTFPTPTTRFKLFDQEYHWIRARTTEDNFDIDSHDGSIQTLNTTTLEESEADPDSVDATVERTTSPPILEGIHQNTQMAHNKRTIEDEILGSSDGSHDQSFACAHAPVIDIDIWVDERSTLSDGEIRRLSEVRPDDTREEYDSRGDLVAFWVRWEAVDDFLNSRPQSRHYVVNRTLGTVDFGDGNNGKIPPGGQDNVKATYTTGGGSDGNVEADTATDLKSSIALVDEVTNPIPADGGADIESTETLIRRSTNQFKHRNRAVTAQDYEQVARANFPALATASCELERDSVDGSSVVVMIIPETERDKPVPSIELKHSVRQTLLEHAPASLIGDENMDIVVRGPGYSEFSVEAIVRARNVKSISLLKSTIEDRLDAYLHPLDGNDGDGWDFGEDPTVSNLREVVSDVEAVSAIQGFEVTFEVGEETVSLGDYEGYQKLPDDTLVCSGNHDITVTMTEE